MMMMTFHREERWSREKRKKRTYSLIRGVANLLSYELVHPLARLAAVVGLETGNYKRHDDNGWYEVRFGGGSE